ncbi:amidohydrolase 2 [Microthyrium microscopicum]|uniref:Amidohydrolase 2 n=1 Tax=Microthyrium microscopicum TaxID=703497 RepID=A0A6A6UE32_9PEZI|nr:amidohydrolase 2 [Microthyrium microscopicum]
MAPSQSSATEVVDIHTHMYPPPYITLLRSRTTVPYIRDIPDLGPRLIILPDEVATGRPIGPAYWDVGEKLKFMDTHDINTSVVSLANPWLDFISDPEEGTRLAREVNDWFEKTCAESGGRLYFFGVLPMRAGVDAICEEVKRLKALKYSRGVVMGTTGMGDGPDDKKFEEVWAAIEETEAMVFLHPHYGLPNDVFGPRSGEYGHVLPLALGFPLETTIAVTRMILSGVFGRFPELKMLLAHSGGTLPFLAGRIQSCIEHDGSFRKGEGKSLNVWDILKKNIYLDAVVYSAIGLKAATEAVTSDRVMFGTDHPFFPPLGEETKWVSVQTNYNAIEEGFKDEDSIKVLGKNAVEVLSLKH